MKIRILAYLPVTKVSRPLVTKYLKSTFDALYDRHQYLLFFLDLIYSSKCKLQQLINNDYNQIFSSISNNLRLQGDLFHCNVTKQKCLTDVKCRTLILIEFSCRLCETAKFTTQSQLRLHLA